MQGDLFNPSGTGVEAPRPTPAENWLNRLRFTLRIDHLAVVAISALILYVLVFSFGVEKGKQIALSELEAEKARQKKIAEELEGLRPLADSSPSFPEVVSLPQTEPGPIPAPPAPGVLPSALSGKYTIQLITFISRSKAGEEVKKLRGKGYPAFILPSGKFYPVCVDAFDEMKAAREKLDELQTEGLAPEDAYVRPLKGPVTL